jgi:hypothetical protein
MISVDLHIPFAIFADKMFLAKLIITNMTRNCSSQTDEVLLGDLDQLEEFPSKTFPKSSFKIIGKWLLPNMAQITKILPLLCL